MKTDWNFLRLTGLLYAVACVVGYIFLSLFADHEVVKAAIGAAVISLVNILLGYLSIRLSFEKSNITFLKIVLGGIGARLFAMAALVLVMIRYLGFQALPLTLSLLFFYIINLGLEIYYLEAKATVKKQS